MTFASTRTQSMSDILAGRPLLPTIFTKADIRIEPYQFERVLKLGIVKKLNEHVTFTLQGIVPEELMDQYVERADEDERIRVFISNPYEEVLLFQGVVTDISVKAINDVRELHIEAQSMTFLMDIKKKQRSFQKIEETYRDLFNHLASSYPKAEIRDEASHGKYLEELFVQYNETDWTFAKRLASRLNEPLIPTSTQAGLKLMVGVPEGNTPIMLNEHNYTVKKDLMEHKLKANNGIPDDREESSISYEVSSYELLELGSLVRFQDKTLYIASAEIVTEGELLVGRYILRDRASFRLRTIWAHELSGASLFGKVTEIMKDQVKIKLDIDQGSDESGAKWFAYSTVYSSPDGSGWYAMPEVGDQIRLYFPDEREKNAFVASSVDLKSSDPVKRSDPAIKSISTKYGKQVVFKPGAVEIIANGQLLIRLTDEGGIEINSNKKIIMTAEEDIQITGKTKITIEGQEGVDFIQAGATVNIKDDVKLSGGKVNIE
ncbi:phage baseplate assembly protein V [Paenibacillus bovis]|nr:phage baseplate assembly protein V [Paenibacillus bovis]